MNLKVSREVMHLPRLHVFWVLADEGSDHYLVREVGSFRDTKSASTYFARVIAELGLPDQGENPILVVALWKIHETHVT